VYTYSYSGADVQPYVWYDGYEEEIVGLYSVHTVSVSVHEAKGQARSLGYRGMKGMARGVRTIAGSLIFTVVHDHPLRPLMDIAGKAGDEIGGISFEDVDTRIDASERASKSTYDRPFQNVGWSVDRDYVGTGTYLDRFDMNNKLGTLLPPFNMMLQYVAEEPWSNYSQSIVDIEGRFNLNNTAPPNKNGKWEPQETIIPVRHAQMAIMGIEIIDEGMVTSINDIVSEVTMSFIARDFKPISFNGRNVGVPHTFTPRKSAAYLAAIQEAELAVRISKKVKRGIVITGGMTVDDRISGAR
jgi:hypothetical protein